MASSGFADTALFKSNNLKNMSFKKGNVQHYDDFSSGKLIGYDRSHLTFQNNAVQFLTEKNGNQFIRLTSRSKQLSNLNKGDKKNTKDRIEIGTPDLGPLKEDAELWWGFRVKLPPGIEEINVQKITFNQFKQIQKNSSGKDCHPGMMWRMNLENPSTWLAVTDGNDNKFNKTLFRNFVTDEWTTVIVGAKFSKTRAGFLKAFRNGKLVYTFNGITIMNNFAKCTPTKTMQTYLRIGVYRGSPNGWENKGPDALDFDDFVMSNNKNDVMSILQ